MSTRLVAIVNGRHFYEVVNDSRPLFTGSLSECRRFERLHHEKELKSRRNKRRRDRPEAKIYRLGIRSLAASGY